MKTVNGIAH